eukprot:5897697-Amphidinium_carterae.1
MFWGPPRPMPAATERSSCLWRSDAWPTRPTETPPCWTPARRPEVFKALSLKPFKALWPFSQAVWDPRALVSSIYTVNAFALVWWIFGAPFNLGKEVSVGLHHRFLQFQGSMHGNTEHCNFEMVTKIVHK